MTDTYLMPLAVRLASERVRADAANTMRHDTTSDLSARLMCRVGVHDLGLVMAWVDQFAALALLPGGVPDGYMLVPREPTEAMIRSGQGAADDKYWLWRGLGERPVGSGLDGMALYVDAAYRAMLSASPKEVSQ